ncbi:ferredoxin family 2Fe-2S iron-sulfur cluster binding protein [Kordiimonas laminariae]|uniref:ferredoxin family 2Fe-2S iron-sulfur cluster binding protein n=1 Tax=Kordiimonas laminariae TaxID=2917717 RepID=UPI001FF684B0|nr:ferredoxin family 2Fe-2S iron-sulfur cluster binding protein [Kordiimonas laminariae]
MNKVTVTFVKPDGTEVNIQTEPGVSLLQLAQEEGLDIEGVCEGNMACSTCHMIVAEEFFDRLPEASEDEEEMLDLASGLTATSRLGCQVDVTPDLDGLILYLPAEKRNMLGF